MSLAKNLAKSATVAGGLAPTGVVLPFAGAAAPSGWILCAGQAVSRSTYSDLFGAIGTTYGVGDGSTTFNLPDLRGRVPGGKDNMGGTAANRLTVGGSGVAGTTLGAGGGAETHTLVMAQLPSGVITTGGSSISRGNTTSDLQSPGNSQAHNNTQPTLILNYIIKA